MKDHDKTQQQPENICNQGKAIVSGTRCYTNHGKMRQAGNTVRYKPNREQDYHRPFACARIK